MFVCLSQSEIGSNRYHNQHLKITGGNTLLIYIKTVRFYHLMSALLNWFMEIIYGLLGKSNINCIYNNSQMSNLVFLMD